MTKERFEDVYTGDILKVTKIIRDNGVGLTVMVDQEGKVLVDNDFNVWNFKIKGYNVGGLWFYVNFMDNQPCYYSQG